MDKSEREYPEWWIKEQKKTFGDDSPWVLFIEKHDRLPTPKDSREWKEKNEPRFYFYDGKMYDRKRGGLYLGRVINDT